MARLPRVYVIEDSISIHYGTYLEQYMRGVFAYSRKEGDKEFFSNLDNAKGANGGDSSMVLAFLTAMSGVGGLSLPFVPNIDHWLTINRTNNTLPEEYRDMSRNDIVRAVNGTIWARTGMIEEEYDDTVNYPAL